MTTTSKAIPVISIDIPEKEIRLGEMKSVDENDDRTLFSFPKIADIEDGISVYAFPFMDMKSGNVVNKKCFICTDNDIIEIEGMGFIPFNDVDKAIEYMEKLKDMIVWEEIDLKK